MVKLIRSARQRIAQLVRTAVIGLYWHIADRLLQA